MLPQEVVECGCERIFVVDRERVANGYKTSSSRDALTVERRARGRKSARSDALKNDLSPPEPAAHGNARIISDNSYYYFFCLRGGVMGPPLLLVPP
jgi:hypothetical protein